jgi:hypothetical protein
MNYSCGFESEKPLPTGDELSSPLSFSKQGRGSTERISPGMMSVFDE